MQLCDRVFPEVTYTIGYGEAAINVFRILLGIMIFTIVTGLLSVGFVMYRVWKAQAVFAKAEPSPDAPKV